MVNFHARSIMSEVTLPNGFLPAVIEDHDGGSDDSDINDVPNIEKSADRIEEHDPKLRYGSGMEATTELLKELNIKKVRRGSELLDEDFDDDDTDTDSDVSEEETTAIVTCVADAVDLDGGAVWHITNTLLQEHPRNLSPMSRVMSRVTRLMRRVTRLMRRAMRRVTRLNAI
ncbi:hypothetical protein FRACYDRAFT_247531 [Fragilariopsis cylindrus CCMP1102]|uniref:Uncharacterized protein n=1 Tax=Fragilariopsis cylindrus CCMP1102 TaxID=635003 RepID=A0A1E7EWU7_9STRA|nr:hypothetical protein FRACYDRAFT_247531 [Fragilariopsis cylindrus CCMP1102]|eukprot:OEU10431.1 hypothetical protein FRACYDRAFT_247531 [Fragilariopsis cylindrus CCMP1102]